MRNKIFFLFGLLLLINGLFISSCTYDQLPEPQAPSLCDTETISYTSHIKAILDATCAINGCHNGTGAPGNFTTYNGLSSYLTNGGFKNRTIELRNSGSGQMPPVGSTQFTDSEIEYIECWISNGYLE